MDHVVPQQQGWILFGGSNGPSSHLNTIEYVIITTQGNPVILVI